MKVSLNAKLGTDKKMEKFWEDIHLYYNELVTTNNKISESNIEYVPVEIPIWSLNAIAGREDWYLLFRNLQGS